MSARGLRESRAGGGGGGRERDMRRKGALRQANIYIDIHIYIYMYVCIYVCMYVYIRASKGEERFFFLNFF